MLVIWERDDAPTFVLKKLLLVLLIMERKIYFEMEIQRITSKKVLNKNKREINEFI